MHNTLRVQIITASDTKELSGKINNWQTANDHLKTVDIKIQVVPPSFHYLAVLIFDANLEKCPPLDSNIYKNNPFIQDGHSVPLRPNINVNRNILFDGAL